jgi:Cysteine-rich CWC
MADEERGILRKKQCAACGQSFDCFAGGCWCDGVGLTDAMRASLRQQFADCLCQACLRERAAATPVAPNGQIPLR